MAAIRVNPQNIRDTASRIDRYISKFEANMTDIDNTVTTLHAEWKGVDYQQLQTEWNEIRSANSTSGRMKTSLQSYANSLREAAKRYQDAQVRAIQRAAVLCR